MTTIVKPESEERVGLTDIINARVTYRNAPMHLLEKFTFKDIDQAYRMFLERAGFEECVIIQTCNRVEIFGVSKDLPEHKLLDEWVCASGLSEKDLDSIEVNRGKDAVMHLIRLASGLESLVIGEAQILGQVRRAFEYSHAHHYASVNLSIVFDRALKAGSRIRVATGINRGNVSVASVAVNLAEEYFDDLKNKTILLIGTGEAASLVAKVLKRCNVNFMIASRAPERAHAFAETLAGVPIAFDTALEILGTVDVIFTATMAPYRLITYERIENAMKSKNWKNSMMIFDLSNPRTVDERVATIHGVKLINMDQIAELVGKNMRSRMNEVNAAEKLVEDEMKSFDTFMKRRKAEPLVMTVFRNVDRIRDREVKKALAMIGKKLAPDEAKVIEQLSYAIVESILSIPMNNLRKEAEEGNNAELMKMVAKLFRYEEEQHQEQR
ncbi:MAG TPA: glutamyl-tRNA reductase [Nitrososphaera sp.]|nr:glutamyl-tRNA reductase [Nitrososphaera sp.]